ncbi:MAG: SUMF1/EgtB/PvdO family nonheme iron enzyme [Opitutales bacterium]|nr:SUMF1/EgtB/PvdO family nonheme iron enzyme [Opitutales bacterium]
MWTRAAPVTLSESRERNLRKLNRFAGERGPSVLLCSCRSGQRSHELAKARAGVFTRALLGEMRRCLDAHGCFRFPEDMGTLSEATRAILAGNGLRAQQDPILEVCGRIVLAGGATVIGGKENGPALSASITGSVSLWHVLVEGKPEVLEEAALRGRLLAGGLSPKTLVWRANLGRWTAIVDLPELVAFLPLPPVPEPEPEPVGPHTGRDWTVPELGLELVWIEAMKLWVGRYEVTNTEYRAFCSVHDSGLYAGHSLDGPRQPVVQVSYHDAVAYGEWLTQRERSAGRLPEGWRYRLPEGEEWTCFARCGTSRVYPWSDAMPPTQGNYADETAGYAFAWGILTGYDDGYAVTAPVEKSGPNEWGLYGVGGNVWEWTSDECASSRAVRGRSWNVSNEALLRVESRNHDESSLSHNNIGFRLLLAR